MDNKFDIDKNTLVSISCITYNHEPYIRQCLNGFMIQKTNFKFEVLIHDDASTDGTAAIIRDYKQKYPDIIKPIFQEENLYSKGKNISATFNWPRAKGKYIAMCEGDDYWTDPLKLQKQVDFLENHSDYGLVYTDVKIYNQSGNYFRNHQSSQVKNLEDVLLKNKITTASTCFRKNLLDDFLLNFYPQLPSYPFGDFTMWVYFFSKVKLYHLPQYTTVYRVMENSASHSSDINKRLNFIEKTFDFQTHALKLLFPKEEKNLKPKIEELYAISTLNYCILNGGKKQFYRKYHLVHYINDTKMKILFYLNKVNFNLFSTLYRTALLIRRKVLVRLRN